MAFDRDAFLKTLLNNSKGVWQRSQNNDRSLAIALADALELYAAGDVVSPPIGAIVAWHKSFANTPTLPDDWIECSGQLISDAESIYDGQTAPNLNGETIVISTVTDTFDRANDAANIGTSNFGQVWSISGAGTWGITGNTLYKNSTDVDSCPTLDLLTPGDRDVSITISTVSGAQNWGLCPRFNTTNSFLMLNSGGGFLVFYTRVAGVYTSIDSYAVTVASGDTVRFVIIGTVYSIYLNGVLIMSGPMPAFDLSAETKVAMFTGANQDGHRWNNFTVVGYEGSISTGGATENRFLRGSTTSGTTRADNIRSHSHKLGNGATGTLAVAASNAGDIATGGLTAASPVASPDETYPRHMDVVWIMRVK